MVNNVTRKLAKGITTGIGVFASTFVGNTIENRFDLGGNGVGAAQMAVGAGVAVASDRVAQLAGQQSTAARGSEGLIELGVEHVGYGIHGAGFAEVADNLQGAGGETGAPADRVVTVNAQAQGNNASQMSQSARSAQSGTEFSVDTG